MSEFYSYGFDQLDLGLFDCSVMMVVSISQEMESNCTKHIYTRD